MEIQGARVLCVEDDPDMMFLVGMVLEAPEWDLLEAADGETALELIESSPPDIALLDYMLPGIDGIELAERLRARFPECPIALFSAHPMVAVKAVAHRDIDTFVPKSNVMTVDRSLRELLERRRVRA